MFRRKIKGLARKIAVKALNMEFDVEERQEQEKSNAKFDPSFIPNVVDGSGDTPGPNHKEDIGRTWLSAQIVGGVSPYIIDIRPPNEVVAGMLPGAILMTGNAIKNNMDILPLDKSTRVTVYDQTGALGSTEIAHWIREQGWFMARRLKGGYAEWLEHDEQIEMPNEHPKSKIKIGDPIVVDRIHGFVHRVLEKNGKLVYEVFTGQENDIVAYEEDKLNL